MEGKPGVGIASVIAGASRSLDVHPERVEEMTRRMNAIVTNGRSTPGGVQANDTGYWPDLSWMTEEEYKRSQTGSQ